MSRTRPSLPTAAAAALLLLLSGCDKLRSTEAPPSYESATVGVAQEIGGGAAAPATTASSAPAAAK